MGVEVPVYAGFGAFLLSVAGVPLARRLAFRWGFIDQPNPRKWHQVPTPRLGGLAVYLAVMLLALVVLASHSVLLRQGGAILLAGTLLMLIGVADDAGRLHHQVKLWLGMPGAAALLIASGIHARLLPWPWLNYLLTIVWVMGIVSAFNLLDNMDGICAGTAAVAAFFFTLLAWQHGQSLVTIFGALVLGGTLGFLVFNFPPATIFLGDGGALFIGLMMAALGLKVDFVLPTRVSWVVPVLILGVPIYDTSLVTFSRLRRGLLPFASPGKDHLSHRLHVLGFSPREVALLHYVFGGLLGLLALLFVHFYARAPEAIWWLFFALLLFGGVVGFVLLERVPYERQERL